MGFLLVEPEGLLGCERPARSLAAGHFAAKVFEMRLDVFSDEMVSIALQLSEEKIKKKTRV